MFCYNVYIMSEKNKNIPVEYQGSTERVRLTRRGKVAGFVAATGLAAAAAVGGVQAIEGSNQPAKMVQIEAPGSGTAWDFAREIRDKDASLREVSSLIADQADKQGYPGVEPGEIYTLPDDLISEESEQQYTPDKQ